MNEHAHSAVNTHHSHYALVAEAIRYIHQHRLAQPELADVARALGQSPFYLQRVFRAWAGVSPKRFLQCLTMADAKARLMQQQDVLSVSDAVGLSSTSRLHELTVTCEALTPGELKAGGLGLSLHYGVGHTPFGPAALAWSARGLCYLGFLAEGIDTPELAVQAQWPRAHWLRDDVQAQRYLQHVFIGYGLQQGEQGQQRHAAHAAGQHAGANTPLALHVRGSNFQLRVWLALLHSQPGSVTSYQALARGIGQPKAARAVGHAVGQNHLAVLIPCHRVILSTGVLGQYRWGAERKAALLAQEQCRMRG